MLSSDHELHAGWRDAGSGLGCADHRGLIALTQAVNAALTQAREIHVTCPLGTDFRGGPAAFPETTADTTVVRFPLSVFTLVPTGNFSGKVVQQGFLVGPGANFYAPYACGLEVPVTFHFSDNQITRATGREADVRSARAHYEYVGQLYGIEPYRVHSWHAGIYPGCRYTQPAAANFERWGGSAFGNPRLLHFHTCGTYAPGEISWNVLDPTFRIDGTAVWRNGVLAPTRLAGEQEILERYPCLAELFRNPARDVGLGAGGQLSA